MRATVYPVPGREIPELAAVEQSWDPDESATHPHDPFNLACAACAVESGAFTLQPGVSPPDEPEPTPEPADEAGSPVSPEE